MTNQETAAIIRDKLKQKLGPFSWVTDSCGYDQHIRFVDHRNKHWEGGTAADWEAFVLAYADMLEAEDESR